MSLSVIKEQIKKYQELAQREQPVEEKYWPSYFMSKNEAALKLEQLRSELEKEIKGKVRLNFIKLDEDTVTLLGKSEYVFDHRSLAREMVKVTLPSMPLNTALSGFQIANLNNKMKELCLEMGVNSQVCPDLYMDADFQRVVHSEEGFVNLVETMVEKLVKNRDTDEEGHTLQSLYVSHLFLNKAMASDSLSDDLIDVYVLVPKITRTLVDEYGIRFSQNMRTIAINEKANITLQSFDELLNLVVSKDVEKTLKRAKKKL